jgi:hypothetical protein
LKNKDEIFTRNSSLKGGDECHPPWQDIVSIQDCT